MANRLPLLLLLLTIAAVISSAAQPPTTPSMSPISNSPQEQKSPNPNTTTDSQELNNIIDALIGAGDFNNWAEMLSGAVDTAMFPLSATFFIPTNDFPPNLHMDPFVLAYHVVPQRLTFSDLCLLKPLSRLPTLLPTQSILVTNTSVSNFTLDDSVLSEPDFYLTSTISVHGVHNFLNYSVYGGNYTLFLPKPSPPPPRPPAPKPLFVPKEEEIGGGHGSGSHGGSKRLMLHACGGSFMWFLVGCLWGFWVQDFCRD